MVSNKHAIHVADTSLEAGLGWCQVKTRGSKKSGAPPVFQKRASNQIVIFFLEALQWSMKRANEVTRVLLHSTRSISYGPSSEYGCKNTEPLLIR
jgi:hypothetical protein